MMKLLQTLRDKSEKSRGDSLLISPSVFMVHSASYTYKYDYGTRNYETPDLHIVMCHVFILILSLPSDVSAILPQEVCILK